jgi:hypothetical protein
VGPGHGRLVPDALLASFRRFFFDTALSSGPALPTLKALAGSDHILFGTDSPFDHGVSAAFTAALDSDDSLNAEDHAAISHGTLNTCSRPNHRCRTRRSDPDWHCPTGFSGLQRGSDDIE